MTSAIAIDEADWPILRVRWSVVSVSLEGLDAFAAEAERIYARGERCAVLVDARGAKPLGPRGIARAIGIERRHAPLARDVVVGRAIVLDHDAAVRALETVLRALPLRIPTRPFASEPPARAWLESSLFGGGTRTAPAT